MSTSLLTRAIVAATAISIAPAIAATIESKGIEAALAQYGSLLSEDPKRYNFREADWFGRLHLFLVISGIDTSMTNIDQNRQLIPDSPDVSPGIAFN